MRTDLIGTDWSNTKEGHKKSCREPDHFYVFKNGMRVGRVARREMCRTEFHSIGVFFDLFKDYYVLDTVNHLYTHIQEVNLQNFMRG